MKRLPELAKAIDALPTRGWDRATHSLSDGINIKQAVHVRGAYAKVLDRPGLDLTTPSARAILALLSGPSEILLRCAS